MAGSESSSQRARTDRGNQNDEDVGSSATRTAGTPADNLGGTQNAGGKTGSQPNRGNENRSDSTAGGYGGEGSTGFDDPGSSR